MLDISRTSNQTPQPNKWFCPKCKTWNENEKTRCSWCSAPQPANTAQVTESANSEDIKITQLLHNTIEKLNYRSKVKLWRWLEDNLI